MRYSRGVFVARTVAVALEVDEEDFDRPIQARVQRDPHDVAGKAPLSAGGVGVGQRLHPIAAQFGDRQPADDAEVDPASGVGPLGGDVAVAFVGEELIDHGLQHVLVFEFLKDHHVGVEFLDGRRQPLDLVAGLDLDVFVVGVGVVEDVQEIADVVTAHGQLA